MASSPARLLLACPLLLLACADDRGTGNDEVAATDTTTAGESESGEDSSDSSSTDTSTDTDTDTSTDASDSTDETGDGDGDPDFWAPGKTYPTPREPNARGLLDRRGLIHAHSVHSHDACDDEPKDAEGNYDTQCDRDFREGLCRARHDFVFLTDHTGTFTEVEFPDTLLYRPDWGDQLVEQQGAPVANWAGCEGIDVGKTGAAEFVPALLQAGCESAFMPVGLPAHVGATPAERAAVYGNATPENITAARDAGAVALVAHTEDWTAQELIELPLQGFEMYNVHANLFLNIAQVGQLLLDLSQGDPLPHPDLVLLVLMSEDPAYLDTWAEVLASGAKRVTTMGTDCHRNTFPQLLSDGQRIDSYERLMKWFGNHLLVEPDARGDWGPTELTAALAAGRLYGVFELLGHPEGFDFVAEQAAETFEMGDELTLAEGAVVLRVAAPVVMKRSPTSEDPIVQINLLRADSGGWEQVDTVAGVEGTVPDLEFEVVEPGAYRAEVRLVPHHLAGLLGEHEDLAEQSTIWVYGNPIYVRE